MDRSARPQAFAVALLLALAGAPGSNVAAQRQDAAAAPAAVERGLAAVYSDRLHGRKTASGERYDRHQLTAAHKTLPFGSRVRVTHVVNGKSVTLRVNDRGPAQPDRILDISPRAARALGISAKGMAEVTAEVVGHDPKPAQR